MPTGHRRLRCVGIVGAMAADFTDPASEKPVEDRWEEAAAQPVTPTVPAEADTADVVEQSIEVPLDEEDER